MSSAGARFNLGSPMPIPQPKVRVSKNVSGLPYFVADGPVSVGTPVLGVDVLTKAQVVAVDIMPELLSPTLGLQLELVRYRTRSRPRINARPGGSHNAYVHPSHGPLPASGNDRRGGAQGGVDAAVLAIRPTEWAVTARNQVIDVTQGMCGYLISGAVVYRQPSGVNTTVKLPFPASAFSKNTNPGTRFPYAGRFKPGYYAFQYSVITDSRGGRTAGPLSNVMTITTDVYPFVPGPAFGPLSLPTASLDPRADGTKLRIWQGATSRLPR